MANVFNVLTLAPTLMFHRNKTQCSSFFSFPQSAVAGSSLKVAQHTTTSPSPCRNNLATCILLCVKWSETPSTNPKSADIQELCSTARERVDLGELKYKTLVDFICNIRVQEVANIRYQPTQIRRY